MSCNTDVSFPMAPMGVGVEFDMGVGMMGPREEAPPGLENGDVWKLLSKAVSNNNKQQHQQQQHKQQQLTPSTKAATKSTVESRTKGNCRSNESNGTCSDRGAIACGDVARLPMPARGGGALGGLLERLGAPAWV